jgi:toxin ParE1/3/4
VTRTIVFRPSALADLDGIWDQTIERWSATQARKYLGQLDQVLSLLADQPQIARLHDLQPPVRLFPYLSPLVVFIESEAALEVIRILHMRSNWRVLLAE